MDFNETIKLLYGQLCVLISAFLEVSPGELYGQKIELDSRSINLNFNQFIIRDIGMSKSVSFSLLDPKTRTQQIKIKHKHIILNPAWAAAQTIKSTIDVANEWNISIPESFNLSLEDKQRLSQPFGKGKINFQQLHLGLAIKREHEVDLVAIYNLAAYFFNTISHIKYYPGSTSRYMDLVRSIFNVLQDNIDYMLIYDLYTLVANYRQIPSEPLSEELLLLIHGYAFKTLNLDPIEEDSRYRPFYDKCVSALEDHLTKLTDICHVIIRNLLERQKVTCGDVGGINNPKFGTLKSVEDAQFADSRQRVLRHYFQTPDFKSKTLSTFDIMQLFYVCLFPKPSSPTELVFPLFQFENGTPEGGPGVVVIPPYESKENFRLATPKYSSQQEGIKKKFGIQFNLFTKAFERSNLVFEISTAKPMLKMIMSLFFPFTFSVSVHQGVFIIINPNRMSHEIPTGCVLGSKEDFENSYITNEDRVLGEGKNGMVFRGVDKKTGREVAIKMKPQYEHDDSLLEYTPSTMINSHDLGECALIAGFDHPNIIQIFGVYNFEGHIYMPMEMLPMDLRRAMLVRRRMPFNEEQCLDIFTQLAKALDYCHKRYVAHRDIKLDNILVRGNPIGEGFFDVVLTDFGNSTRSYDPYTTDIRVLGSRHHLPPEGVLGVQEAYVFDLDVWALAISMIYLNTTVPPYTYTTFEELAIKILKVDLTPALDETLTPKIKLILKKVLRKRREDRISLTTIIFLLNRFSQ